MDIRSGDQLATALWTADPSARGAALQLFLELIRSRHLSSNDYLLMLSRTLKVASLPRDLNSAFIALESDDQAAADEGLRTVARYAASKGLRWTDMFLDDLFVPGPRRVAAPPRTPRLR